MFSAYTWGQFWTFILVVVGLYYLVIGLLYYRIELKGLISRKADDSPVQPVSRGQAGTLVKSASAFPTAVAATTAIPVTTAESANDSSDDEQVAIANAPGELEPDAVSGTVPASAAAGIAVTETGELSPALSLAEIDELQDEPELDSVDEAHAALVLAAVEKYNASQDDNADYATENSNHVDTAIEESNNSKDFSDETVSFVQFDEEPIYADSIADEHQVIDLDEGISAELLLQHLAQGGAVAALPHLAGTSLAQQLELEQADLNRQHQSELDALFSGDLA